MPQVYKDRDQSHQLVRSPIYHQLNAILQKLITQGDFNTGDQFLTEREVSERFDVSRVTANKALSHLVVAGALEFRKGVGTFVRSRALENDLRSLVSFTKKAALDGKRAETRVLKFVSLTGAEAGPAACQALQISAVEPLYRFERLRLADSEPVILERRFVIARRCPGLTPEQVNGSFYILVEERFGLRITGAEQIVRSINLNAEDAHWLGAKLGASALWVHAVGFAGSPLWLEDTLYRGDRYEFRNSLGSNQPASPAILSLAGSSEFTAFGK
jgi:GntR family transcriptional regulator